MRRKATMAGCIATVARHTRDQAGLTQRELAQLARVPQSAVARFEGGAQLDPERVEALLDAYGSLDGRRAGDLWHVALALYANRNGHPAKLAARLSEAAAQLT